MKVLLVEDNEELAGTVKTYLNQEGLLCETAANFMEGEEKLALYDYDVTILDLMLPDGNGIDLIPTLKKFHPDSGLLILSAKNALDDKIKGLEMGADDYLAKPFHLSELNARIKAIYRRRKLDGNNDLHYNEIIIKTAEKEIWVYEEQIDLTRTEYDLFLFLVSNKNRVLTKQAIAEHLLGENTDVLDSFDFVYQHVKNLRKKIAKAGGGDYIHTIYGLGYKFKDMSK